MTYSFTPFRANVAPALVAVILTAVWAAGVTPAVALASDAHGENANVSTAQVPTEGSDIASGHAVVTVDKPIGEVLSVLLDYGNYVRFMPNFTRSRVLAQRGSKAMVYMEVSVAKGMYTLYGQLKLDEQAREGESRVVRGTLVDGNINAFNATFTLTPVPEGTQIDFKIYVDPDLPLPSSVFSRENERAAGRAVRALRQRIADAPGGAA